MEQSKEDNIFIEELRGYVNKFEKKKSKPIYYANMAFIEDFVLNTEDYMEIYGLETVIEIVSGDIEHINSTVTPYSLSDYLLLCLMYDNTIEHIMKKICVKVYSIKNGMEYHTEKDFKMIIKNHPEEIV